MKTQSLLFLLVVFVLSMGQSGAKDRPNVLFLAVDDMNEVYWEIQTGKAGNG